MSRSLRPPVPHWALLRRTDIEDVANPGATYLARLRIIETPLFGIFLHAIRVPDKAQALHNHPWPFASVVLSGGYTETFSPDEQAAIDYQRRCQDERPPAHATERHWGRFSIHRIRHGEYHTITTLDDSRPAWTVIFVGRRRSDWGYATADGYVSHRIVEDKQREPAGGVE